MLPFEPESLESMRLRLLAAISCVYDADEIEKHNGIRPGEQRQHVFDFENGIRCICSLDRYPDGVVLLHMSFSTGRWEGMSIFQFFDRVEHIPTEFWPDTLLVEFKRFMTPCACHVIYQIPPEWKRFYKACGAKRKTVSSAG